VNHPGADVIIWIIWHRSQFLESTRLADVKILDWHFRVVWLVAHKTVESLIRQIAPQSFGFAPAPFGLQAALF
jgi:hypothetical protein